MNTHIPRRSGSVGTDRDLGPRQVIPPAEPKPRLRRARPAAPPLCGAVHPERPGIVDDATGDQLTDPVLCTAELRYVDGQPVKHRGKHRARLLRGVVVRWEDAR